MTRLDPEDARQGRKGTPVLRILIAALVLVVIAGIGMWIYGAMMPGQSLPDANTGAGLAEPTPSTAAPAPAGSTVTPGAAGSTSGGSTPN